MRNMAAEPLASSAAPVQAQPRSSGSSILRHFAPWASSGGGGGGSRTREVAPESAALSCQEQPARLAAEVIAVDGGEQTMPIRTAVEEPQMVPFDPLTRLLHNQQSGERDYHSGRAPDPVDETAGYMNLRYAKFAISGFSGEKHAVFVPDRRPFTAAAMEQICDALGVEPPSLLLSGVGGISHPLALTTQQLHDCPAFRPLVCEGQNSLGLQERGPSGGGGIFDHPFLEGLQNLLGQNRAAGGYRLVDQFGSDKVAGGSSQEQVRQSRRDAAQKSQALEEFVSHVFEKRAQAIASSVAHAVQAVNGWTITGPEVTSFEALLHRCSEQGNPTGVLKAVAVHMQDKAYMENHRSRELMKQLFDGSVDLSPAAVDNADLLLLPGDLWNPAKNTENQEFREHGFDFWSFSSLQSPAAAGHPLVRWPWPLGDVYLLFYREAEDSRGNHRVDWEFKTERPLDQEAVPLQQDQIATPAYLFMGGEDASKKSLFQLMQVVRPVVILDNTPGVAKQMSLLLKLIQKALQGDSQAVRPVLQEAAWSRLPSKPSSMELVMAMSPNKILQHVEAQYDCSGMSSAARLSLSDIINLMDTVKRKPYIIKETITMVDPLLDSPEEIVAPLTATFCSTHVGGDALGLGQMSSLLLKGWSMHRKLFLSESRLRWNAAVLEVTINVLMLLSTLLAVIIVHLQLETDRVQEAALRGSSIDNSMPVPVHEDSLMPEEVRDTMKVLMLVFPISVGLLMTMRSHFQFHEKWTRVHLAAASVAAEIFQFLGSVGPYATASEEARRRFLKRVENTIQTLSMLGILEESYGANDSGESEMFTRDSDALSQHIEQAVYGLPGKGLLQQLTRKASIWARGGGAEESAGVSEHVRDLLHPLTADVYMKARVTPLITYCSDWVKSVSWLRTRMHITIFCLLGFGCGLAALGWSIWVPICMVAVLCVLARLQALAPAENVVAVTMALTAFNKLDLRFHAAGIREQRSEAMKRRLILTTERVMLAVAAAMGRSPLLPDDEDMEEVELPPENDQRGVELTLRPGPRSGKVTPIRHSAKVDQWPRSQMAASIWM